MDDKKMKYIASSEDSKRYRKYRIRKRVIGREKKEDRGELWGLFVFADSVLTGSHTAMWSLSARPLSRPPHYCFVKLQEAFSLLRTWFDRFLRRHLYFPSSLIVVENCTIRAHIRLLTEEDKRTS